MKQGKIFSLHPGNPAILDEIAKNAIEESLQESREKDMSTNTHEFTDMVIEQVVATKVRRGGNNLKPSISNSFQKQLVKDCNFKVGNCQRKTHARLTAEADPRNSYSEALLFEAFQTGLDPSLIINMDATQYFSSHSNEGVSMRDLYVVFFSNNCILQGLSNVSG